MKKTLLAIGTVLSLTLVSCGDKGNDGSNNASSNGSGNETKSEQAAVNYELDANASSLKWKGSKSLDYFHVGSLKFTSGSLTAQGTDNVKGEFVIDMNSMSVEDEKWINDNDQKIELKNTLSGDGFFNVSKFKDITVKVDGYKDGKLSSTLTILGKELKQDIPVKLTNDGSKITIIGKKFELDLKDLNIEGLKVNTEKPDETIKSIIEFDLNLVLNKK
jgi:polyisoprenoid-binding protein YceI